MNNQSYPVVQFLVARGRAVSYVLAIVLLLAFLIWAVASGSAWIAAIGVVTSAVVLGLALSYIEVLRIIADTLLPKY